MALPWASVLDTLTRRVVPSFRSRTNTSLESLVSPGTRFDASELKATYRPSELIAGPKLTSPLPWVSVLDTLTRRVVPSFRSRTNTSWASLVSPGTRFDASE